MTRDEARRQAIEAARQGVYDQLGPGEPWDWDGMAQAAVEAYERAMADAGWRMQPIVGESSPRLERPHRSDTSAAMLEPDDAGG